MLLCRGSELTSLDEGEALLYYDLLIPYPNL